MKAFTLTFILFLFIFTNCQSQNSDTNSIKNHTKQGCLFVSDSFTSINSALDEIDNTSFTFRDTYYPKSTKILETSFYACEKKDGHMSLSLLIIKTKDKSYIFRNVPKNVWGGLRKAKSIDSYLKVKVQNKYENVLKETDN